MLIEISVKKNNPRLWTVQREQFNFRPSKALYYFCHFPHQTVNLKLDRGCSQRNVRPPVTRQVWGNNETATRQTHTTDTTDRLKKQETSRIFLQIHAPLVVVEVLVDWDLALLCCGCSCFCSLKDCSAKFKGQARGQDWVHRSSTFGNQIAKRALTIVTNWQLLSN